jgi:hypothetical protein
VQNYSGWLNKRLKENCGGIIFLKGGIIGVLSIR